MKKTQYLLILAIIQFSSCNYKRFTYLQTSKPETDTLYKQNLILYKLQPADILYVKVLSLDKNVTEMFNQDVVSNFGSYTGGMFVVGHSIDIEGNVNLPILGKIYIAGLTIDEAKQKIEQLATTYVNDARIELKLVSFKISMVGEFNHPGQYTIANDRSNIFEAIALAGDLSYNGNRKNVLIVRALNTGTKTIRVDLTKRELLSSQQYFLQPNDIVYVQPFKTTVFRLRVADYSIFLTLVTSTITAILLINNAIK
jgi:polysaccharide export outer membrane protein